MRVEFGFLGLDDAANIPVKLAIEGEILKIYVVYGDEATAIDALRKADYINCPVQQFCLVLNPELVDQIAPIVDNPTGKDQNSETQLITADKSKMEVSGINPADTRGMKTLTGSDLAAHFSA